MESTPDRPTAAEASAALTDADASRARLADGIATPPWFFASLATVIAVQIAATAVGLGDDEPWALVAGVMTFAVAAALLLLRFRRLNGVWLGGFASRVVLGTGTAASTSYVLALGMAIWAAYESQWWLMTLCSLVGGATYALSGRRWLRTYRTQPAGHGRGESVALLALVSVAAIAGFVLLVLNG
jgi:hypothetical protein